MEQDDLDVRIIMILVGKMLKELLKNEAISREELIQIAEILAEGDFEIKRRG